jgi:hypothetical protein
MRGMRRQSRIWSDLHVDITVPSVAYPTDTDGAAEK